LSSSDGLFIFGFQICTVPDCKQRWYKNGVS
jgi:hypothetical protein